MGDLDNLAVIYRYDAAVKFDGDGDDNVNNGNDGDDDDDAEDGDDVNYGDDDDEDEDGDGDDDDDDGRDAGATGVKGRKGLFSLLSSLHHQSIFIFLVK